MTDEQPAEIESRLSDVRFYQYEGWDVPDGFFASDVPALLAEVRRLNRLIMGHHTDGAMVGLLAGDPCSVCKTQAR